MAATIGKVRAVFTASTSGLTAGVNSAAASMRRMESAVNGLRGPLNSLVAIQGAQLFGSIASAASNYARSLAGLVVSTAEAVSSQNDLANRLGMTYAELAGLSYAGSLVGVSTEQIGAAFTRAQVAIANAAAGSATATKAFERIGLSVEQLQGMTAEQQFEAIAEAISQLPTEAERAAAAVQLFGRAGAQLLPLFNQGAEGIQAARAEAERFGLTLNTAQANNVDAMGDAFGRAKAAITGVINQVVAYLAPAVQSVTDAFSNLIGNIGGANIGQAIGDALLAGARSLAEVADALVAQAGPLWNYVSQVGGQWSAVFDTASRVASVFAAVGRFLQGAFLTVVGAFTGIGQALLTAVRGAAAALGFDTSALDTAIAGLQGFNDQLGRDIESSFNAAGENLSAAFSTAGSEAGEAIAGPFTQTIDEAIAAARAAADSVDVAARQEVVVTQKIDASAVKQAVQGIESTSAEGIKEMFRIMRGDTSDQVPEQQLAELRGIRQGIEDMGDGEDFEAVGLAPAAGG